MSFISSGLVAVCAEVFVDSIDGMVDGSELSPAFVGLILLPIAGNAAEAGPSSKAPTSQHFTAVAIGIKDKMDLAIAITIGSSMQIVLFVIHLTVLLGCVIQVNMSLFFNTFRTSTLFITDTVSSTRPINCRLVDNLIQDGQSNYLEGLLLMGVYLVRIPSVNLTHCCRRVALSELMIAV